MERKVLEISWVGLWRVLFFVALAALMYFSLHILLGLFLAIVISAGLEFLVNFLENRGIPRTLGVILVFLVTTLGIIVAIYTILPLLLIDLNTVFLTLNKLAQNSWWGEFIDFQPAQSVNELWGQLSRQLFAVGGSPLTALTNLLGGAALTLSILISAFYLSLVRDGIERFIRAVFPQESEETALRVYANSRRRIGFWFRSQILLSLVMGGLVLVALLILGVKHAVLLAILTAIFELVPYIGPIIAGSAAVLSALAASPALALTVLIVFLILHQVESHILIPLLIGRNVGLHPVIVIMALLIGLEVGGFLGILVSVPATVVIQEILEGWSGRRSRESAA